MSKTIINASDADIPLNTFRNVLINGDFRAGAINQRGSSPYNTSVIGSGAYSVDRWRLYGTSAGALDILADGGVNLYHSGSTGYCAFLQIIETANHKHLRGKTVTLSMDCERVGDPGQIALYSYSYVGETLTGTATPITVQAVNVLTTRSTVSISFVVPDNGDKGLYAAVEVAAANGSNYLRIFGIQLEEGPVATPIEARPRGLELSLCYRYYFDYKFSEADGKYMWFAPIDNPSNYRALNIQYPTTMRVAPSITRTLVTNGAISYNSIDVNTVNGCVLRGDTTATSGYVRCMVFIANAEI